MVTDLDALKKRYGAKDYKTLALSLAAENERFREVGQELEAYLSAIDNIIAPLGDERYPIAQFDFDFDAEGVYKRIKDYATNFKDIVEAATKVLTNGYSRYAVDTKYWVAVPKKDFEHLIEVVGKVNPAAKVV